MDGRFVVLLYDLPKVPDFGSPIVLLFEFLSVVNMICDGTLPWHINDLVPYRSAKHAGMGIKITMSTTLFAHL